MLKYLCKFTKFSVFNRGFIPFKNSFSFRTPFSITRFCSKQNVEIEESPPALRDIQMNPRYEAGLSFFVAGDYERALNSLKSLKRSLRDENNHFNEDYLFLLRKIISINKVNKDLDSNFELLEELKEICIKLYKSDFNYLFDDIEYITINLTNSNPEKAIKFIDEIIEEKLLPDLFNHILKYYQGSAYILEGKNLEKAIEILESIEEELTVNQDNKYLKACVYNNKGVAKWWLTMSTYARDMKSNKGVNMITFAREMLNTTRLLKSALVSLEDVIIPEGSIEFKESSKEEFLKYILSPAFDTTLKMDKNFQESFAKFKDSLTENKASALILSNLAELYYNIRDYSKSLIFLNAANLYFNKHSKNDPLFYKNLAIIAMCSWKLTNVSQWPKGTFDKILNVMKGYGTNYEKVYIFRLYGEMLIEENSISVLGNNLIEEADKMESTLPSFECRRIYLALPSES